MSRNQKSEIVGGPAWPVLLKICHSAGGDEATAPWELLLEKLREGGVKPLK
jgi:hypothetical protein